MKKASEYEKFDEAIRGLLRVPHAEVKAKLEAEKTAKKKSKKEKA